MILLLATIAVLSVITAQDAAARGTFSCVADRFCTCLTTPGCSAIEAYLHAGQTEICKGKDRRFQAIAKPRAVLIEGDGLPVRFRETRPYFTDLDWYQSGQTQERGLLNLRFDNESDESQFHLRQMVRDSVNNHRWAMSGTCQRIE